MADEFAACVHESRKAYFMRKEVACFIYFGILRESIAIADDMLRLDDETAGEP